MLKLKSIIETEKSMTLSGAVEGYDALIMAEFCRALIAKKDNSPILFIARDDARLQDMRSALQFFAPDYPLFSFPAWDCLPYDRVSPNAHILADRMTLLAHLARGKLAKDRPSILLTTVNAISQKLPPKNWVKRASFHAKVGDQISEKALIDFLITNGYIRVSQVREAGEFAIRGGLIDIFAPGLSVPYRLDLFGDELDSIRTFDPLTQRTIKTVKELKLIPISEFSLDADSISRFRQSWLANFGTSLKDKDSIYDAVSEGRRFQGAEHWLPLFHDHMETLYDYLPPCITFLDQQVDDAMTARLNGIADYYQARRDSMLNPSQYSQPYKAIPASQHYLDKDSWQAELSQQTVRVLTPYQEPETPTSLPFMGKRGRDFVAERQNKSINIYDALKVHIDELRKAGKRVLFASYSKGARERLATVLKDHKIVPVDMADSFKEAQKLGKNSIGLIVLNLEHGFETDDLAVITETDVLGDRLVRKARRNKKADNIISELSALTPGDLVVHMTHGIGRFEGLETMQVGGAAHDCLKLVYKDDDKLYLPVENIEMLTKFGSEHALANLDKLGGTGWQMRHAKLKKRIRDMADELIKVAATRQLRTARKIDRPEGLYEEFCARFPYTETDDQLRAINDIIKDFAKGEPMDRLVCGDVGFGKTEVALRSAFLAVMEGMQVAIIAPTTLLARQHYMTFKDRFRGLPVNIQPLSRLVSAKEAKLTKKNIEAGHVDIVIGTHALLAKDIKFKDLGFIIIDEEQHFGVAHKERLKQMKNDVHVLTLTATPIPRTLQLAMSGMRNLSLIATPPVDRLAVRTFVMPFDEVVIKEAIMREHYRGGQSFYVCPRIADLEEAETYLKEHVPDLRYVIAHGQMAAGQLEDIMNAFYEGRYDVLISTTIIESGIDIPSVNTMVLHRADMFGLAQMYQLRGRVGRSKIRAYCYLTVPANKALTKTAEQRLQVLQSLDTLGAGFTIASHDMDIRGAGNLLGEEQSGHIKEVGMELYQQMLEEAVAEARHKAAGGDDDTLPDDNWSPNINLGASVLIPDNYVSDLNLRMGLYRRLADLQSRDDIEAFAAELIDRFGALPQEVKHLLSIIQIKAFCKIAGIEKLDTGPKGATISFRNNQFSNPAGLIEFISKGKLTAKLRPDHKLVYLARWDKTRDRLKGVMALASGLARVARAADR